MASTYLTRTPSSAGNRRTFTISAWIKRGTISSANSQIISSGAYSSSQLFQTFFESDDTVYISDYTSGGSKSFQLSTNRKFRDTNSWYHILFAVDTTQGTASNRVKVYVNGVQETSFSEATYPSQNFDCALNLNQLHTIANRSGANFEFSGSMSHFHLCDGTALAPTVFGSTDSTTGEWKINTSPSFTPGTNGFTILKDGNTITDQSANSNNWSLGSGTLTKTEDSPSNVFATWNPLYKHNSTFTLGNTKCMSGSSGEFGSATTLGMSGTGKYYAEFKWTNGSYPILGVCDDIALSEYSNGNMGLGKTGTTKSIALKSNGSWRVNNSDTSLGGSYSLNNIIGCAIDKSTNKIYFSNNGQWSNGSGAWDSTTFNASTGAIDVSSILTGSDWFFACGTDTGTANQIWEINAGNGYFGTTAVSSAGTNASGIGIFEYNVPTGYTALSTKGLNL